MGSTLIMCTIIDVQAGNSNLARRLGEKSNHAMYQDENQQGGMLPLQKYQN